MAVNAEQGPWEQVNELEARRAAWEADVTAQQAALREGSIDHITGNTVQDIVIALHGVEGIVKPKILKAWQGLADRFEGSEEEPYLVVERPVGTRTQNFIVRPKYWVGTVPDEPFNYEGGNKVTLRSSHDFTIASMFPKGRVGKGYLPLPADGWTPVLAKDNMLVNSPEDPLVDRITEELDKPIKSQHDTLSTDFEPYQKLVGDWAFSKAYYHHPKEYPVKHPLKQMSMLEVVVGEKKIKKWASRAVGDEKEIVTQALKHQLQQQRLAEVAV